MPKPRTQALRPRKIRLDASTACQLKCAACPTASGQTGRGLGVGSLKFADFKSIVDENPWVSAIELSNWGEVFLNKELVQIAEYAYRKHVALYAFNGANLNHLDPAVAEALVRYRFRGITCSIDGASQESYRVYRVGGDFQRVMANVKTINRFKWMYRSRHPRLHWQFIAFGHNEHEIDAARSMARDLDMTFGVKLSWEDLYTPDFSPVVDKEVVRRESGLNVASRSEFRETFGREYYLSDCCSNLWSSPQVNFDGRMLGCPVNHWGDFGNAFRDGLLPVINGETMSHAREMLLGMREEGEELPCVKCRFYQSMKATNTWLSLAEIKDKKVKSRRMIGFETLMERSVPTSRLLVLLGSVGRKLGRKEWYEGGPADVARRVASGLKRRARRRLRPRLKSGVFSLNEPIRFGEGQGWKPLDFFRGRSRNMRHLSCHMSALKPGHSPHPPHRHKEEELLLLLSGEIEIPLPDLPGGQETTRIRLEPGEFVYYPAFFGHTLTTTSAEPARYLMFKWHHDESWTDGKLAHGRYDAGGAIRETLRAEGFRKRKLLEGETECLERLQAHTSTLSPGAGYAAHADPYDVGIVVFEGEVETLGRRVGPGGLILYAAGEPHGMRNPGDTPAGYLVLEFQGRVSFKDKLKDPRRWRRKIDRLLRGE